MTSFPAAVSISNQPVSIAQGPAPMEATSTILPSFPTSNTPFPNTATTATVIAGSYESNGVAINATMQSTDELIKSLTQQIFEAESETVTLAKDVQGLLSEREQILKEEQLLKSEIAALRESFAQAEADLKSTFQDAQKKKTLIQHSREDLLESQKKAAEAIAEKEKSLTLLLSLLKCCICMETLKKPKVIGACGHAACGDCIESLDRVSIIPTQKEQVIATPEEILKARRCPLCRADRFHTGIPVQVLDRAAQLLETPTTTPALDSWQKLAVEKTPSEADVKSNASSLVTGLITASYIQQEKSKAQSCFDKIKSYYEANKDVKINVLYDTNFSSIFKNYFKETFRHYRRAQRNITVASPTIKLVINIDGTITEEMS